MNPQKILEWVLERPAVVVVVLAFAGQIIRGLMNARKRSAEHQAQRNDPEEERRLREVQEKVRRQIAERRASRPPVLEPPPLRREAEIPPQARPETTQMPEPFGGPLGRMLQELQKQVQPPPVIIERRRNAELERQEQLADALKSVEQSRALAQHRAVNLEAEKQASTQAEPQLRSAARGRLLGDLGDPQSLRRAFVLREVLGPPIALR